MKEVIKAMAKKMVANIMRDVVADPNNDIFNEVFAAYNQWQEDEKDGCDYMFSLDNSDDLRCCLDGGMTAKEIVYISEKADSGCTPIFLFGYNHPEPNVYKSWDDVLKGIIFFIEDICYNVIAFPDIKAYQSLYTRYVTNYYLERLNEFI